MNNFCVNKNVRVTRTSLLYNSQIP